MSNYSVTLRTHYENLGEAATADDLKTWDRALSWVCEAAPAVKRFETIITRTGELVAHLLVVADSEAEAEQLGEELNERAWNNGSMRPWLQANPGGRRRQSLKRMLSLLVAGKAADVSRALNGLVGTPEGAWGETSQAVRRITEALPLRDERNYNVHQLIGATMIVDDAGRFRFKPEYSG